MAVNTVKKTGSRKASTVKATADAKKSSVRTPKTKVSADTETPKRVKKPLVAQAAEISAPKIAPRDEFLKKAAKSKGPKVKAPRDLVEPDDSPSELDEGLGEMEEDAPGLDAPATEAAQWMEGSEADLNEDKRRKAVVPPKDPVRDVNLFEYLRNCTPPLDQKIIDISLAQSTVPLELRPDAAQEIRLVWSTMKPDLGRFKPGQIASYAHRMAKHTALRLRRELGSSVRLPGSAFRKRRDGSSYVTPGVLSVALDWNELEGWLDMDNASADDAVLGGFSIGTLGAGEEDALAELGGMVESYSTEDNEEEILKQRLQVIENIKDKLTERQYQIMMRLSRGDTYEEIQRALAIKKGVMMRELNLVACILGPM